jgi:hypothetical protein
MRSLVVVLVAVALLPGCYLAHENDDTEGGHIDTGRRDGGTVPFDGRTPDTGLDANRDGAMDPDSPEIRPDTGVDGGSVDANGPDAPPPLDPPPDPSTCRIVPTIDPFTAPILEQRWPGTTPFYNMGAIHVCATPVVIDLDAREGDIQPVVVFTSYEDLNRTEEGFLRIWDPRTDITISYPASSADGTVLEPTTNLAAGDLDGDGVAEIVGIGTYTSSYAFRADGTLMWESPYPTVSERGDRRSRTISGAVSLADLEGDGTVEVIIGRTVLEGTTGHLRWNGDALSSRGTNSFLGPISCVADLDGDGVQEVIAGRSAIRADGSTMWVDEDASQDGFCAVAEIVADSVGPEVVLVSVGYVYVIAGPTGETLWVREIEGRAGSSIGGTPTVADFDGDGRAEIGIAHGAAYGVYDLDCTGPGAPDSNCHAAGLLWTSPTEDSSSASTGSSVFDFNGDGRAEVVYNDQFTFRVYDGLTGFVLVEELNSSRTRTEYPVIADVDSDGDAEIVFSANAEAGFLRMPRDRTTDPGVEIWGDRFGRWVGARPIWNQHTYHITNVDERGHVASPEQPSWLTLDAYRQNLREGSDVLVVPDVWGGRGGYTCLGRNRARFAIDVANYGLERAGAGIVVGFYRGRPSAGGERIGEAATTTILLPSGGSETVTFDVDLEAPVTDYYALLDDPSDGMGGAIAECREDNNEVLIWRPSCP